MSRPGFVLEVDERTPPLLIHEGEGFRLEPLPLGTRVIYPPDSLPGIRKLDAAIQRALLSPADRRNQAKGRPAKRSISRRGRSPISKARPTRTKSTAPFSIR